MADEAKVGGAGGPEQRPSGRSRTLLYMILSLVVVGGFLAWLGMASEPTTVVVSEEDAEAAEAAAAGEEGVVTVEKDSLAENKAAYAGQRIRVAEVEATSQLGPGIFWGELGDPANQVPILVRLDSAVAEGFEMRSGGLYTLTGELQRMSDSLATAWGEQGEFRGEGEQMQATFTDYFIQTSRIQATRGTGSGGDQDGDADASNGG